MSASGRRLTEIRSEPAGDPVVEVLARIEARLAAIEERLPVPDDRLPRLLRAAHAVVGEAEFAAVDLLEEAERDEPLRAAISAAIGERPDRDAAIALGMYLGHHRGEGAGGLRLERRRGRTFCILAA